MRLSILKFAAAMALAAVPSASQAGVVSVTYDNASVTAPLAFITPSPLSSPVVPGAEFVICVDLAPACSAGGLVIGIDVSASAVDFAFPAPMFFTGGGIFRF